jgi:HEAT repeat protein
MIMRTLEEILPYLNSINPRERAIGLMLVGRERIHTALGQAVRLLNDTDSEVRATAAWALDQLSSPVSVPALIEMLYDPVFTVRSNAGWALVHIAKKTVPQVVVPDVVDVLRDELDYDARQMAYLVLYHIGDETSWEAIRLYWKD